MSVLLDTSVAVAIRESDPVVFRRAERLEFTALLSILSVVELEGGVPLAPEGAHVRRQLLDELYQTLQILDFGQEEARQYAQIVAMLGFSRTRIIDRMIAAQALVTGSTLATLNPRDFREIPGLMIEDWSR